MCKRCTSKTAQERAERNRKRFTKRTVYCTNCKTPLKALNNKLYHIEVASAIVTEADVDRWKEMGYDIIIEQ